MSQPKRTRVEEIDFSRASIDRWRSESALHSNWPVVYTLNNERQIYIGETLNAVTRMRQHLDSEQKRHLRTVRVVLDDHFNKSACLDLESFLIRMFSGDGQYAVLNRNVGVTDAEYFDRARYNETFREIFEQLRQAGLFTKKIAEIENSDLFKLSPFKALNIDQETVVESILDGLFSDMASETPSSAVVEGGPGTGKTIVAIYLLKLLTDVQRETDADNPDAESAFSDYFQPGHAEILRSARLGLVVPQQSLRASVKKVFAKTPGLSKAMVLTPYEVASAEHDFDVLIVDEAHRLTQYGAQAMGTLTKAYRETNKSLALDNERWEDLTQIDWIIRRSRHQVFVMDEAQAVRPIDVPKTALDALRKRAGHSYRLMSQMRVRAGEDYITYVKDMLSSHPPESRKHFQDYDLRFFDSARAMRAEIAKREEEHGLARTVAGYAWPWASKRAAADSGAFDIELEGMRLCWNRTATDWINSESSIDEVGSIHTVQGYDLNYVGVIIGPDLKFDPELQQIVLDRDNYFDTKGKANLTMRGQTTSDADVLRMVRNIYSVLLTRGMLGTYLHVVDPYLRERLRPYFPPAH